MKVLCIAAITNATYNKNNKAPKTESCSAPWVIEVEEDLRLETVTENYHSDRCDAKNSKVHPDPPSQHLSLSSKM